MSCVVGRIYRKGVWDCSWTWQLIDAQTKKIIGASVKYHRFRGEAIVNFERVTGIPFDRKILKLGLRAYHIAVLR